MTQQVVRARVQLPTTDTTQDNASLDLYFEATGSDVGLDFTAVSNPLTVVTNFFNSLAPTQVNTVASYMSNALNRATNMCAISWTDITAHLDGTPAGAPFRTDFFTLGAAGGGAPLAPQLAIGVGYRGDYGSTLEHGAPTMLPTPKRAVKLGAPATHLASPRPRSRYRGRFYLGPLSTTACAGSTYGQPSSAATGDVNAACQGMFGTHNSGVHNQFNVVQWSRRDATVRNVKDFFINEHFTTQRRRGDTTIARVHSWIVEVS